MTEQGYKVKCIVSDGHWALESIIEEENFPHQRCIFHIIQNLQQQLTINGELKGSYRVLYSRLKYVLKSPTIEKLATRVDKLRIYTNLAFLTPKQLKTLKFFFQTLHNATLHLSFTDLEVPRTNNRLENLNGQIKARLKTFRGVKSEDSLNKILKIIFKFRNFK